MSRLNQELRIVVAGHICLDMTPQFTEGLGGNLLDIMRPGKLNHVGPLEVSTGGAVSNVGIALVRLGASVRMMGKVGDDSLGSTVVDIVSRYSPDAKEMVREGESTSYTVVLAPPGTDRVFLHHTGCNDTFSLEDIDLDGLADYSIFHFGYPTLMRRMYENNGLELVSVLQAARNAGLTVSLDMAMYDPSSDAARQDWRSILEDALPLVDVFLPSLEECIMMVRPDLSDRFVAYTDRERELRIPELALSLAHEFVSMGAGVAGVKCGALGYCVVTGGPDRLGDMGRATPAVGTGWVCREIWAPGYSTDRIRSTTGAGDSSIAGFLMALASGESIEKAANAACAVGWQNLRAVDAFSGVGTWDETLEMVSSERPRNRVSLPDAWTWEPGIRVWLGPRDSVGKRRSS